MVTVSDLKAYLKIPYDDDDTLLSTIIQGGVDYLADAVEDYSNLYQHDTAFQRKADFWIKTQWAPTLYDNREGMTSDEPQLSFIARSMLTQLQCYTYVATTSETTTTEGGE